LTVVVPVVEAALVGDILAGFDILLVGVELAL
jgi:hypothetical protein